MSRRTRRNIGKTIGGALGGAGTGAAIGSFGGPIGTGIGAGIGGLAGFLSQLLSRDRSRKHPSNQPALPNQQVLPLAGTPQPNQIAPTPQQNQGVQQAVQTQPGDQGGGGFFEGTPQSTELTPRFDPEQEAAISQSLQQALAALQDPSAGFDPIAQEARTQFQQQTIPSLAERFTSMGDGQRSSAFAQTLGQAGAGLEQNLASQKAQFGLENMGQLQNLLGLGLTPKFDRTIIEGEPSPFRSALTAASPGLGEIATRFGPEAVGALSNLGGKAAGGVGSIISQLIQLLRGAGQGAQQTAQQAGAKPRFSPQQQFGKVSGLPLGNFGGSTAANLGLLSRGL